VGLRLADAKPILARLQEIVVSEQLERYCETVRLCPRCHRRRHLKDYRSRRYDTVFGRLVVSAPRFDGCRHCGEGRITSPVSELLPDRVSPELCRLETQIAGQFPYPSGSRALGGAVTGNWRSKLYATTRNRTLTVGKRIEEEIRGENRSPPCCPRTSRASRENGDYQRATGPVYRSSFSTGGSPPNPQVIPVSLDRGFLESVSTI
jgi:hypothetical protein